MLKSVSTQFAATLFFGPLGLAYCSVAAAVFFTLLLAVLVFTEIGVAAVLLIWPLSMMVGLVFVKLHNDGIRSSGSRLLLGPGEEVGMASAISAWARGVAVVALVVVAGYLVYLYLPESDNNGDFPGRIVQPSVVSNEEVITPKAPEVDTDASVIPANSRDSNDDFSVIALPQREVATVVIDDKGEIVSGQPQSALRSGQPELTVSGVVVNLRKGPGTSFSIVAQVERGDKLYEFARDGQWINVESTTSGVSGWIYRSLVQ